MSGFVFKFEPAVTAADITPSDSTVLSPVTRGLWIGTGGDIALIMADDSAAKTFKNVPSGVLLPFSVKKVMLTNTTATDIRSVG